MRISTASAMHLMLSRVCADSYLDLAVRGKLVEQSPKDEPASTLIKQVLAKKAEITKEGSVRKEKPLPPLAENDCPFSSRQPGVGLSLRKSALSTRVTRLMAEFRRRLSRCHSSQPSTESPTHIR